MNKVQLTGRIANDLDVRVTQNNRKTCRFGLAVRRTKKDNEGNYQVDYINIQCWEQKVDFLSTYAKKGTLIGVSGSVMTSSYVNKEGQKVHDTFVLADQVEILSQPQEKPTDNYNPNIRTEDLELDFY